MSRGESNIIGPIHYVDPKLLIDRHYKLNKKSDVYSVGVLLWRILSGREPFDNNNNPFLSIEIQKGLREEIIDGVPIEYVNLYTECWQGDPSKRPDMQHVVSTLNQLSSIISLNELFNDYTSLKNKVKFIPFNELKNSELLARGSFGKIKKAIWTKRDNHIVYKRLIKPATVKQHDILDAFIHELQIHLHLDYFSSRIIRCLGISQDDEKEYLLVMEYANGGNLRDYLKNNFKNLTWDNKIRLASQIADGLNYLHNENVLHRDLHSKNIVIHENNAKITDFGISKIQNDQNSSIYIGGKFGNIAYMEPKRIIDPNFPYTKSSDIYSFGKLMWEISSGYPPTPPTSVCNIINNGLGEVTIPNTPKNYEKLYKNCCNQEPEQRPTTNEILNEFKNMGLRINNTDENKSGEITDNDTPFKWHDDLSLRS